MSRSPLVSWLSKPFDRVSRRQRRRKMRGSFARLGLRCERLEPREVPHHPGANLSGFVYIDVDDDGVFDANESGIAGVTITLTGITESNSNVSMTTTTDLTGRYSFTSLAAGTYDITETQPAGFLDGKDTAGLLGGDTTVNDKISNIVVTAHADCGGNNFGERTPTPPVSHSVSGFVFCDADYDGIKDAGEEGIAGVTVDIAGILADGRSWGVALTTTDANGRYEFSGLLAGTYTISEHQPPGFDDGKDTLGTPFSGTVANDRFDIAIPSLTTATTGTDYNFGELRSSSISGRIFNDVNRNGQLDVGDTGLAGVTMYLLGVDAFHEAVFRFTTTDAHGNYHFANLRGGTYRILENQPNNFLNSSVTVGSAGGIVDGDTIRNITLTFCVDATGYNFGDMECPPCPPSAKNSLSGYVYQDCDLDGIRDAQEKGIAGVTVTLTGIVEGDIAIALSTTTDVFGKYQFADLLPGIYRLTETQPSVFLDGKDSAGVPFGGVADPAIGADEIRNIVIPASTVALAGTEYNFGEVNGSLSGFVYEDVDDDGVRDPNEPGIGGVLITLTGVNDLGHLVSVIATTGSDGSYSFLRLRPGTYRIAESQPVGYDDGKDTIGSAGGALSGNDVISHIVVDGCTIGNGYNFGERKPPPVFHSISGFVFCDVDNDGVRDPGEAGIAGVLVDISGILADGRDAGVAVTTTDAAGRYFFGGLLPGIYQIHETQPPSYEDGKDALGSPFSGVVANDLLTVTIPDSATAQNGVEYNFGEIGHSSISGLVYLDQNRNGIFDSGDSGIAGVTLTLQGTDYLNRNVSQIATTNSQGVYIFGDVAPGTYEIIESQPNNLINGKNLAGSAGGTVVGDSIRHINLFACTEAVGYFFGEQECDCPPPPTHALSGFVFEDCDLDGLRDGDETGIAGVMITLTGVVEGDIAIVLSTTTNASGFYIFNDLKPGIYRLEESQPAAFLDGMDRAGTPFGGIADSRIGFDVISKIAIPESALPLLGVDYNFGEVRNSIRGSVYEDKDDDGVRDIDEGGIQGVTVTLTGVTDLGETITLSATTGADGAYAFTNLRPGTYKLTESQPAGFIDGKERVGDAGGSILGNDVIGDIILKGCTHANGYNFGERRPAEHSISGFVFEDCDNDGVRDANELGIAGVSVTLEGVFHTGGVFAFATTTDANGRYEFSGLQGGLGIEYTLRELQPANYLDGIDSAGTPFGGSADARIGFDVISGIVIPDSATPIAGVEYNFGEVNGSIGGVVYEDRDQNGRRDAGEPGIAGVTVTLTGTNDIGETVTRTMTTEANGTYLFDDLRPGEYKVAETQPPGFVDGDETIGDAGGVIMGNDVIGGIVIDGCTHARGYEFGEIRPALHSISGFVYVDCNNNGIRDAGENGIAGVEITLSGAAPFGGGVFVDVTTTDASGRYEFSGLPGNHTYTISESQPSDYLDGKDRAGTPFGGSADARIGFDVISGIVIPDSATPIAGVEYNFGEVNGSIGGVVYEDRDQNGRRDAGEPGIAGVTVTLTGTNDIGETVTRTMTTEANGTYLFDDLRPGEYKVAETQPPGFVDGDETIGDAGGVIMGNDVIGGIVIDGCTHARGYEFGEIRPALHSISGFVYCDDDNDGIRDLGEQGIGGVIIELVGENPAFAPLTTTTGADGSYRFDGLVADRYTLFETQPTGYADGKDRAGTPFGGVGDAAVGADRISNIVIPESAISRSGVEYNFGELNSGLSGFVYEDLNDDGIFDANENGIAGVTIVLVGTNDLNQIINLTTTTDVDGYYEFTGLRPGSYHIGEHQPAGYIDGKDTVGSLGGLLAGNDTIACTIIGGCDFGENYNFGERPPALHSLSGVVFEDCDNDGVRDGNETGIAGVTITLTGAYQGGGVFAFATTTDANGEYEFTGLSGGSEITYTLLESQPSDYLDGIDRAGTPFGGAADARIGFDVIDNIVIPRSATPLTGSGYNFGEVNGSLGGIVYEDTNRDGHRDASELGIPGVTITLSGANDIGQNVSRTTTTNQDGRYLFEKLRPGTYTISESQPSGYFDGADSVGDAGGTLAGNDMISHIVIDGCTHARGYNFGEHPPALHSISGFVYCDDDNDGIRDVGDEGIAGVTVRLIGNGATLTATTDAAGRYIFSGLRAGTYTLVEEQPAGHADGRDRAGTPFGGTADAAVGADRISNIVIPESAISLAGNGYNFGELNSALSGFVYEDLNNDGIFDLNETGIAGVTIVLVGTNDLNQFVQITTTTEFDGYYEFSGLRPGTYHIGEHQPAGWIDGKDTVGSLGGQVAGNDTLACTLIGGCAFGVNYNFGERREQIGHQGLTPGYWKANAEHWNAVSWESTGYSPNQSLGSVFVAVTESPYSSTFAQMTLLQALNAGGGGVVALLRHAVAAVLNAAQMAVDYPMSLSQIVSSVNTALRSQDADEIEKLQLQLDWFNNLGAPLDQHGNTV